MAASASRAQAQSLILGKIASRSPDVVHHRHGAELARPRRTDREIRHRRAEAPLPAAAREGPRGALLLADRADVGLGRRDHARHRHCHARRPRQGRETLGIRLSWDKRYITLGPKATLVGLAFRLFDPENLLGRGEDIGITVALIPANHPGVNIGRRHLPSGAAFPNGPNWGKDVFIPMDWIIGGEKMAGQGWRMLMECLAAGRAISLPSSGAAGAKAMLRFTTAYGRIRKQFGLPVAGWRASRSRSPAWSRRPTSTRPAAPSPPSMVARGEKPSVISAIMKYQSTERLRRSVNDAMDLHGGRGICDGPSNYLQSAYQMVPVGITVEGANILTRSLITFAQGALRSHPYLYSEIQACQDADRERGLAAFENGLPRPRLVLALERVRRLLPQSHRRPLRQRPGQGLCHRGMVSPALALLAQLRLRRRPDGGVARRRPQDQAEADRPHGRRAVGTLSARLRVEALRGRRPAGRRPADRRALRARNGLYRFQEAMAGTIDNFPLAGRGC